MSRSNPTELIDLSDHPGCRQLRGVGAAELEQQRAGPRSAKPSGTGGRWRNSQDRKPTSRASSGSRNRPAGSAGTEWRQRLTATTPIRSAHHAEPQARRTRPRRRAGPASPGGASPGRGLHRPHTPATRRVLPGGPGPRVVRDLQVTRRAVPPHVHSAARQSGGSTLARLLADSDHDWLTPPETACAASADPSLPPSCSPSSVASFTDLEVTGDIARTHRAFDDFLPTIHDA